MLLLVINVILLFVGSVTVIYLSQSFVPLLLGRLLQGLSGGVIAVVVPLYLAECLPADRRGLGDVEAADQVHHHRGAEGLERHRRLAPEHAAGAEDAGAVHGDVEATEEILRGGDVGGHAVLVGHVGAEVARVRLAERGDGIGRLVIVDVEQGDAAALRDQGRELLARGDHAVFEIMSRDWLRHEVALTDNPTMFGRSGLERTLDLATWIDLYSPTLDLVD